MSKSEPYESSPPISQISQPIPHRSQFISQQTAVWIIEALIDKAITRAHKNQAFRENLKKFSKMKTISNIDEIGNLNFYESSMYYSALPNQKQPRALYIDSLLPISADIDKQNSYKKRLGEMIQSQLSEGKKSKNKSISKKQLKPQYFKLDLEPKNEQQDGFTKELRKMQQQRETKVLQQDKAKRILDQQQRQKQKEKKKEKQQKFSYDYNGSPIKVKSQGKVNLISKSINGNLNKKTQLIKQVISDSNPTLVDSVVLNQKKNLISIKKRQDGVQFQDNRTLAEGVSVGSGIKYTYEGKTFQAKKKIVSTMQLKKTLSNRRLNREEFERVKSMNGASIQLNNNEEDFRNTKHTRSQSQVNLKKGGFKKPRQIQKIIVLNDKLKEKLLQKVSELMEQVQQIENNNPQKKYQHVSQIDIFNMNYLRGGKETKNDKILENLSTERSLILPKINSTLFHKGKNILPKQRERIKQIKTVVYDIRKKYDERLQY